MRVSIEKVHVTNNQPQYHNKKTSALMYYTFKASCEMNTSEKKSLKNVFRDFFRKELDFFCNWEEAYWTGNFNNIFLLLKRVGLYERG